MEVKTPKEIRDFHSSGQRVYFAEEMKQRISFFLSDKLFGKNLDIGGGRYSYYPNSTVVDLSPVALEYNQSKEKLEFDMDSIANGNKLPFPDHSFDHATMVSVFQYIKHRKKVTQELMRVLKPGAEVYIINCRGGLSECIQNSYHSSEIQNFFEKEGFTTMIENIPFRSDIKDFQSVCVAMPDTNLFGHTKGSIRNKNERILQNKIYSNYKPFSHRWGEDDWDDESKSIDVFTNAYFAQEIRKVNDLFYKLANHPITTYSLEYKKNIEAFTQECLAQTNAIPIITSYIGNDIAMNMLTPGEESHISLHILGKEKKVPKEDEDSVMEIAKKFNLDACRCYGHFRSAHTPEDIATFYKNRHNDTTYDSFYGEYREGILTEDEKYTLISTLAEIPLNSSTKSLQDRLYPIAKSWFADIDELIFQKKVRSYYGLLYNYKQRRGGEKLLEIKNLCKQGKIDIIGREKIDYLPIIQKFPAILAKHDQDAFRGSKAICED